MSFFLVLFFSLTNYTQSIDLWLFLLLHHFMDVTDPAQSEHENRSTITEIYPQWGRGSGLTRLQTIISFGFSEFRTKFQVVDG